MKFNERFCFNEHCLKEFLALGADEWITPIISGVVQISYTNLISNNNLPCEITLISRRDKSRTGMRFVSRGADVEGNVSNFAETEQIIQISQDGSRENPIVLYSFVQTRGSMPFLWQQKPDMKWEPKGAILGGDNENSSICQRHFEAQLRDYGPQTIVNLIDKKGFQLHVGEYFEKMVKSCQNNDLRYVWFDFHSECRKMKYENLSKLLMKIREDLEKMGWFQLSYSKSKANNYSVNNRQRGVVRTNCVDCLDRTNVTQSVIARFMLHRILVQANLSQTSQPSAFEKFSEELETIFRELWTKNADVVSILYTGTGALKTDFTRLGKRTIMGSLKDGQNSIMRYVLNHFYDGYKQNCVDLLVGKLNPRVVSYKPKKVNPAVGMALSMLIIPIILVVVLKRSTILQQQTNINENVINGIVVIVFTFIFAKLLQANNRKLVEKPILKC